MFQTEHAGRFPSSPPQTHRRFAGVGGLQRFSNGWRDLRNGIRFGAMMGLEIDLERFHAGRDDPRRRASRMLGAMTLAAAVALGGSGCFFPNASQVDVVLSGPQAADADLVVTCSDLGCSTSAEAAMTAPPTEGPFWIATDLGEGDWSIDVSDSTPEKVTIEVLEWRRTADTGQCPGPVATDPITIDVG